MVSTIGTRQSLVKIKDTVEYYQHQLDGIRQMARMGSLLLADEMGLGKSLQALTVAAIDFEIGAATRVLIVSPASLKWNWQDEIEQFTNFSCRVLDGTPYERGLQLGLFTEDILIVNYEQVKPHLDHLNAMHFDIVICDEAHYIKNRQAARTKSVHNLIAKRFLLLTGSPILNHVDDLWALLHRIDPVTFSNYHKFLNRYAVFGGYKDKEIVGVKNTQELVSRVHPLMIRRKKEDVLKLPPKLPVRVLVDLHPEQRKLYDQARDELLIELPDNPNPMELENALTKFLRLLQICGTTACIPGYPDQSIKLDVAVERIEQLMENDRHVVVFTQFRPVQACLNARLAKLKIPTTTLNGTVEMSTRSDLVKQWGREEPGVLSCTIKAAGVGLNMTQASTCIFLDRLFAPKLNEQAEDRLHRIGTTDTVEVVSLLCRNTIEARVEQILKRKIKTFGEVVEESSWKRKLLRAVMREEAA